MSEFLKLTAANADLIEARPVDLEQAQWDRQPIAILINDVWKNFSIANSTVRAFFPYIQRNGLLINQDYLWCTDALVQLMMHQLRHYFEPAYQVPNGNTVSFRCIETPPLTILKQLPAQLEEVTSADIDAAVDWSRTFLNVTGRGAVELGRVWLHQQQGNIDLAVQAGSALMESETEGKDPFVLWQTEILKSWGYGYLFGR